MRRTELVLHLSSEELKQRMLATKSREQFQRWQVIYMMSLGKYYAEEVATLVGITQGTVYQWVYHYNHQGPDSLILEGRGGRRGGLLSWEEEVSLLADISKEASSGLVVIARPIRKYAEKKLGRTVSEDFVYDLLHRHGWRKVLPRPHHPKAKVEEQEEFKKNSPPSWRPPKKNSHPKISDR